MVGLLTSDLILKESFELNRVYFCILTEFVKKNWLPVVFI